VEAHQAGRIHDSRYETKVGRDLFDEWMVAIR
jgi:hypothetical protein